MGGGGSGQGSMRAWGVPCMDGKGGVHAWVAGGCQRLFMGVSGCGSGMKLEHASMPILACSTDLHLDGCLYSIPYGPVP